MAPHKSIWPLRTLLQNNHFQSRVLNFQVLQVSAFVGVKIKRNLKIASKTDIMPYSIVQKFMAITRNQPAV